MKHDLFLALTVFAFVSSITPGPNNLMLMASGVNFGFRRSLPHMFGVAMGFTLMVLLVGLGLAGVVHSAPRAMIALQVLSVIYMLWLAWKIATSAAPKQGAAAARPFSFLQAAGFQWVNPKAWAMALTATSVYAADQSMIAMLWVALVFGAVNLPSISLWVWTGQGLRRFLADPRWLRGFNWTMAALLILSLWPVLKM